eukprot:5907514-Prymnesium_polylepis.1
MSAFSRLGSSRSAAAALTPMLCKSFFDATVDFLRMNEGLTLPSGLTGGLSVRSSSLMMHRDGDGSLFCRQWRGGRRTGGRHNR